LVVKVDDDLFYPKLREVLSDIPDQRLTEKRYGRLCTVYRQRKQPRAKAGGKDHCLHKSQSKTLTLK
jgi:hypothetical protein